MLKYKNKTWLISKFISTYIIYHIFTRKSCFLLKIFINPLICFHRYCDKIWFTSFIVVRKTSQKLQHDLICNPVCTTLLFWQQGANAWKFVLWNFFTKFCRDPYVRFHRGMFLYSNFKDLMSFLAVSHTNSFRLSLHSCFIDKLFKFKSSPWYYTSLYNFQK